MMSVMKPNRHVGLWWLSAVALSIGIAIYILLKPSAYDVQIQRYRSLALVAGVIISGLCIIIGTSKRWFGKDL
jgi:hypothetical protein